MALHLSLLTIGTDTFEKRGKEKNAISTRDVITRWFLTSCRTVGRVPPSLSRPQPVTVALAPTSKSSVPGKQIGAMWSVKSSGVSSLTSARSYSYVKKLYFGWTIFLLTARSTYGNCSWTCEKSYSPTRMRIWLVRRLRGEEDERTRVRRSAGRCKYN